MTTPLINASDIQILHEGFEYIRKKSIRASVVTLLAISITSLATLVIVSSFFTLHLSNFNALRQAILPYGLPSLLALMATIPLWIYVHRRNREIKEKEGAPFIEKEKERVPSENERKTVIGLIQAIVTTTFPKIIKKEERVKILAWDFFPKSTWKQYKLAILKLAVEPITENQSYKELNLQEAYGEAVKEVSEKG